MSRLEPALARRLVAEARVARLATVDPDGRPNVVPFCPVLDGETIYFAVDRKPKSSTSLRRTENIAERPDAVTILVDHFEETWERLWWVRLRGRGRVVDDAAEVARAESLLREKFAQMREDPPAAAIVAIDVVEWRSWSYA